MGERESRDTRRHERTTRRERPECGSPTEFSFERKERGKKKERKKSRRTLTFFNLSVKFHFYPSPKEKLGELVFVSLSEANDTHTKDLSI
jgi:hypothetical protein